MRSQLPRPITTFLRIAAVLIALCASAQAISTHFIDKHGTFSSHGQWWHQQFTLGSAKTVVLRMTSDYGADAAIIRPSELSNFTNNRSFSGFALFDNQFGTNSVTLPAGTYYLAVRSQTSGANTYRLELDYDIKLPNDANFTYSFVDTYISGSKYVSANGGRLWHGFTIQAGFRYLLDGCNTGLSTYIIPASELSAFRSGSSFNYYTSYSGTDNALPGLSEITLPPGSYYLAFHNSNSISKPITYSMERWRKTARGGGGGGSKLDLAGPVSWRTAGKKIVMKYGKISNKAASGRSGSLRLRVWATKTRYRGGSLRGYILGNRRFKPLSAGYFYRGASRKVALKRPPKGRYFTVMTLEEYTSSGWRVRDHITFKTRKRF